VFLHWPEKKGLLGMQGRKIADGVWWVGAVDWDRKLFDSLIPLPDGTSYNSYLVRGASKTALIETVDYSMKDVLFARLKSLQLTRLDYVISNHAEQDHTGVIPDILDAFPTATVLTSDKGKPFLKDLLPIPEDRISVVRDGETLDLGDRMLQFIYFPWVHWPETMLTYLPAQKILFSCDLFGSHLATADLFAGDDPATLASAKRYYAEILMAFKSVIEPRLDGVAQLGAEMIAPSHGPIYRQPGRILDAYREWISAAPKKSIVIPYVSMHGSTRLMVDYLVEACAERGIHAEQFNLAEADIGKLAISLVDAAGIVLGSPMLLGGPHPKVSYAAILANTLRPKAKFVSVIGSFGWGGRLVETLQLLMPNLKVEVLPPVLSKGIPRDGDYAALDALADAIQAQCTQTQTGSQTSVEAQPAAAPTPSLTKYMCPVCRYVYDPAKGDPAGGIPPGTPFESLPDSWVCPICRVPKRVFKPI
jgi:flavorubredoxin/rubredoxin